MPTINQALRHAIVDSGQSQKQIAIAAKMLEPRLSGIIHGRQRPRPEECAALAAALGKLTADLFAEAS